MRLFIIALTFSLIVSSSYAAERENRPDPMLTPGDIVTTDKTLVCMKGFSKMIRRTTSEMKRKTYRAYELRNTKANKIDHLVPLSLGGADTMKNLWPSDFNAAHHDADDKDRLELKIRKLVCTGKLSVSKGQKLFLDDWHDAYDTYCSTRAACPSYKEIQDAKGNKRHTSKADPSPKKRIETLNKHEGLDITSKGVSLFDGMIFIDFKRILAALFEFLTTLDEISTSPDTGGKNVTQDI